MKRPLVIGLLGLVGLVLLGGVIMFLRLTAPVAVTTAPPVAPTLSLNTATSAATAAPAPTSLDSAITAASATQAPAATAAAAPTDEYAVAAPSAPAATKAAIPMPEPAETEIGAGNGPRIYRIDPAQSQAAYRVKETFINRNNTIVEAVGTTKGIAGDVLIDPANPAAVQVGEIVVDISQLTSDSPRRDNAIRRDWLESAKYPQATFKNAVISDLPETLRLGTPFSFKMTGDMTVRAMTKTVTWDVTATLAEDALTGKAMTTLRMSEFGVTPPDIGGILRVEDEITFTIDFVALVANS